MAIKRMDYRSLIIVCPGGFYWLELLSDVVTMNIVLTI